MSTRERQKLLKKTVMLAGKECPYFTHGIPEAGSNKVMKTILTILASSVLTVLLLVGINQHSLAISSIKRDAYAQGYKAGKADGSAVGREALERLHQVDLTNIRDLWIATKGDVSGDNYRNVRDVDRARLFDEVDREMQKKFPNLPQ